MFQNPMWLTSLLLMSYALQPLSGQQHYTNHGHPPPPPNGYQNNSYPPAAEPQYAPPVYTPQAHATGTYSPGQSYFPDGDCITCQPVDGSMYSQQLPFTNSQPQDIGNWQAQPCNCPECCGGSSCARRGCFHRKAGCLNGRCQPDCRNCNWGPAFISFFGGATFIDNLDMRTFFDNGMMNMVGIEEIGFSTRSRGAIGASVGRYFYRQLRVDLEYTYRVNDFREQSALIYSDDLSTPEIHDTLILAVSIPAAGTLNTHSLLANWVFDLRPRTVGCFNGYIGGGIGALYADGIATTAMDLFTFDDTAFAFQGIGGVNYPIRDRIDLYAEYRYLGVDHLTLLQTNNVGTRNVGSFRMDTHSIFFGCRLLR